MKTMKIRVTVRYRGQIKQAAGVASETVEVGPDSSVMDLAEVIAREHGDRLKTILFSDDGALRSHVLFIVSDQQVLPDEPTPFKDGDLVTILPPMAGG